MDQGPRRRRERRQANGTSDGWGPGHKLGSETRPSFAALKHISYSRGPDKLLARGELILGHTETEQMPVVVL